MTINFMFKLSGKRLLSAIALSASLITGIQYISIAQGNSGLTLWSGVGREHILNYRLDYGGRPNQWDRYRLRIPADKMENGASKFILSYPSYYDGIFDKDKIEINFGEKYKQKAKIREITLSQEIQLSEDKKPISEDKKPEFLEIEIDLEESIPAGNRVEIKFSNVKNPRFGGTYYFNAQVIGSDQFPVRLYVGTWIVSIER